MGQGERRGGMGGGGGTATVSFFILFLQSFSLGNVGAVREVKVILGFGDPINSCTIFDCGNVSSLTDDDDDEACLSLV